MEIAINSLLIFLLLVFPGLIFRRFYYVGEFSKQFNSANWLNSFYISIIPGIIIQIFTLFVYLSFIEVFDEREPLICYINSFYLKIQNSEIPYYLFSIKFLKSIAIYFLLLIGFASLIAQLCWIIVRQFKFDIRFKPLRFSNHWHYYFSGEVIKTRDFQPLNKKNKNKKVVLTEADVLVDIGNGENTLYKGFISQYTICRDSGDLKTLYLTQSRRFKKTDTKVELKDIPGDIMVIPFDKVINLNLTYVYFDKDNKIWKVITSILTILSLVILMLNPFGLIFENLTLYGEIIGRIWLFGFWILIFSLISTLGDLYKNYKKETLFIQDFNNTKKKIENSNQTFNTELRIHFDNIQLEINNLKEKNKNLKTSITGTLILLIVISIILYSFFKK